MMYVLIGVTGVTAVAKFAVVVGAFGGERKYAIEQVDL